MKKKLLSLLLSLAMSISLLASLPVTVNAEDSVNTFQGDGYKVTYTVNNSWQNNLNVGITVTNTGTESIENWALKYDASGEITGLWGGVVNKKDSSTYIIENAGYNLEIKPNDSVNFGYQLTYQMSNHIYNLKFPFSLYF